MKSKKSMKDIVGETFDALKGELGYMNAMQAPKVAKVVVSVGVGKVQDKQRRAFIADRIARITGQKAAPRAAKKSIASFKLREGDTIGYQVTLRGPRMFDFLAKFIHLALPQTRDFRGIQTTAIDEMGNLTVGVREHTIFPETADEELKDVFGFAVTVVTTAQSRKEAEAFFRHIGMPLQTTTIAEIKSRRRKKKKKE